MNRFSQQYEASKVAMLALSLDREGWDIVTPYIAQNNVGIPVGVADRDIQRDYPASGGVPFTYVVSPEGIVVDTALGGLDFTALQKIAREHAG